MRRDKQGEELMNKIFGEDLVSNMDKNIRSISPGFSDFLKETFFDIYSDSTLDLKTKEIVVIASLITQKDTKPQLKGHIAAALKAGVSQKEILAIIKHLVIYIGFPGALNALMIAKEVFEEK